MFTHIMIGSNDLQRSKRFYDATFMALGGKPGDKAGLFICTTAAA